MAKSRGIRQETDAASPGPRAAAWERQAPGLSGAIGSLDRRYARYAPPGAGKARRWSGQAWRGERVQAQFVLWTRDGVADTSLEASSLTGPGGAKIAGAAVRPYFVRYVAGDGRLWADILEPAGSGASPMPARTVRPVWLSVDVPPDAKPGKYSGTLLARPRKGKALAFSLELEVLPNLLPPPALWKFHLDLWQNPFAVAGYHDLKLWSGRHWARLGEILKLAAGAGQKCLTVPIVHRPWGGQTHDAFSSLVEWKRDRRGRWKFDYSLFDRYVDFGLKCGITGSINCYSIVPWEGIRYYDEAAKDYAVIPGNPEQEGYELPVSAFLADFSAHLKRRGIFDRTLIAMDERPVGQMQRALDVIAESAPGMRVALAGDDHKELYDSIHDYCFFIKHRVAGPVLKRRAVKGRPTTFYVCCGPERPNNFTFSPPAESAWMGWFAAARGYDGFLRWAFNSWNLDPLADTTYRNKDWPAGDCFLVYPGPLSSIRFERLREGIQDYEKIRILKGTVAKSGAGLKELDRALAGFDYPDCGDDAELAARLNRAKEILLGLSRRGKE